MIDKNALYQLANVINNIKQSYGSYQFYKISQTIQHFASVDLSNVYFDVAKDCLYVGRRKSQTRRGMDNYTAYNLTFLGADVWIFRFILQWKLLIMCILNLQVKSILGL